jgi:hypothetical protein
MMAYIDVYSACKPGADTWGQAAVAISDAARDVRNESEATENHAARLAWANSLRSPESLEREVARWIHEVMANATIRATLAVPEPVPDGDMQFVVNSLVNLMAGG